MLEGLGVAVADAAIDRGGVAQVVLEARHHGLGLVGQLRARVEVQARVRHGGHAGGAAAKADLRAHFVGLAFGGQRVERPAQLVAGVVQAQRAQAQALAAAIDIAFAIAPHAIGAHAPLVVAAKAPAHIEVGAELGLAHVGAGDARQRRVAGALGHQVDVAADAAARADAIGERARALEHFDALYHLQRHARGGHQAVQAVERDVTHAQAETADLEVLAKAAACLQRAHRGVAHHHVGDVQRLLVLDIGRGVVGGAERHVHQVAAAQDAQVAAARQLAARIGLLQTADGRGLVGHDHFLQGLGGGLGDRAQRGHGQAGAQALGHQASQGLGGKAGGSAIRTIFHHIHVTGYGKVKRYKARQWLAPGAGVRSARAASA